MNKNDIVELNITAVSSEGNGIGRASEGITVFVPGTAVGDVVKVLILKVLKNYCFGKVLDIIKPSNHRINPDCEVFSRCGGCCFRHINYDSERNIKTVRVRDAVSRIGGIDTKVNDCITGEFSDRYRNKGQYPIGIENGKIIAGFYSLHSHRIIPCKDCKLQPFEFKKIVDICLEFFNNNSYSVYDQKTGKGLLRHIYLRKSDYEKKTVVCIVANGKTLPNCNQLIKELDDNSEISSVILNINQEKTNVILGKKCVNLFGKEYLTETLLGVKFNISPLSFFQVNRKMTEKLYSLAAEFAEVENKTVLDLFCGAGTIGLTMANRAKAVIGVEIIPQAVKNAEQNAKNNGIKNARFICSDADGAAKDLAKEGIKPDVIVLDPPRKGATPDLIETICNDFSPERVVYVSCDPATLARDLKLFEQKNYLSLKIQPVDMFPRTAHVETVVLMLRK